MTYAKKYNHFNAALYLKMLKRDFPVLVFSLFILIGFFVFMRHAFRASIAIQEGIKFNHMQSLNGTADEVFFGDELFDKELQQRKLAEPNDSRELKAINLTPSLGEGVIEEDATDVQHQNEVIEEELFEEEPNDSEALRELAQKPKLGERLKELLHCVDRPLKLEKIQYGSYWLVRNYIRGEVSTTIGCADSITLTTNGDYTFFDSLPVLIERWKAPLSFALFAPGYDFDATLSCIQFVRNCLPESEYVRDYVSFHIYFPATDMPEYMPLNEEEALLWPYNCDDPPPYENVNRTSMYKTLHNMTYPINVGRNIARKAANTYFIFASDIELIPSPDLPRLFLEMVERNRSIYLDAKPNRVFTIPVFEVTKESEVPENKTNLIEMLRNKTAIHFHSKICKLCHLVPQHSKWENASDAQELTVFSQTKREGKFIFWEPFYISDNQEPIFDERVSWEGQSNKRIQGYAMCLLRYDYYVLHPAFLVHSPGIKYFVRNSPRLKYVPETNRLIKNVIQPEYKILYGTNNKCRT